MFLRNIVLAIFCLPGYAYSYAQTDTLTKQDSDSIKVNVLEEVIVTGNVKRDPAFVIIKEDFTSKAVQPKSSGELFSDISGFSLIKRGNYAVEPSFRASQYEQLNVLYDGGIKATHACPIRMDPVTTLVNPEEVTRIEIVKGPYTVRYGQTFGGMINMITSNRINSSGKINGSVSSGYESNGNAIVNVIQLRSIQKKLDLSGTFSHRNYGNYKDGGGREIPSSFESTGYSIKTGYNFTEQQRLQLSFRQNFGRNVLHAGLPMDTKFDNSSIAGLDYRFKSNTPYLKDVTITGYYSFVDHKMNNNTRPSFISTEAVAKVNSKMFGARTEGQWSLSKRVYIFGGFDYSNQGRKGSRDRLVKKDMMGNTLPAPKKYTDEIWQNASIDQKGVFAEAKYSLGQHDIFTFGSRLDWISSSASKIDSSFKKLYPESSAQTEINLSGTISYKRLLSEKSSLEIAFGRGTRTANLEEKYIAYFNIGSDPYEYIGNPYLKPEVNNQFEIGYKGEKGFNGFFTRLKYSASVYYSIYEKYILGVVDTGLKRKFTPTAPPLHPKSFRNTHNAIKTGFEVMGSLQFADMLGFTTEMNYVYTESKDLNESLPLTPPFQIRLQLEYAKKNIWARARYIIVSSQNRVSKSFDEVNTKGYQLLNFEAGITPVKKVKIGVAALNITNELYHDHLNFAFNNVMGFGKEFITEPGRNFTVFASLSF
jgi:iron complex outermembrane recepter protein